jgi:hypothetical protein
VAVSPPAAPVATPPVWGAAPDADAVVMRRRNTALMIGGLVMIPIGIVGVVSGIAVLRTESTALCLTMVGSSRCSQHGLDDSVKVAFGYTTAISGGLMIAGGTVMAIVGGQRVPRAHQGPRVGIGPGSVDLTWTF